MVIRSFFLDASIMVKLVADEKNSEKVKKCFDDVNSIFSTTNFCFFESLSVLKRKWLKKEINQNEYIRYCRLLFAYKMQNRINIEEYPLKTLHDFGKIENLTERYNIDVSDGLQLLSIKETILSHLVEESETTLITTDKDLAKSAEKEGVKVKYIS